MVVIEGVEVQTGHLIGGAWVSSPQTFETRSPLDWEWKLADISRGDGETADAAVRAAIEGFGVWSAYEPGERAAVLRKLADLIDERSDDIAIVETIDMGFRHESMRKRLVARGAINFRTYADIIEAHEDEQWDAKGTAHTVMRMPAGPAVVITPWNAPFMLATWKLAPALASGNSVLFKPAEWSPLSAALLAELTVEAGFPPGVFNLVQGIGEEVGAALVSDERVRRISFTGSPATAKQIGKAAAENLVPFTAELGGKGPLIVFEDADIELAAAKAAEQYEDSGQVCLAGTRLLIAESIADEFRAAFKKLTEAHVLGDPRDDSTTVAPVVHPEHLANISGLVERSKAEGDHIVWGGEQREGSLHYELTLIEPRSNDSHIVQNEVFGPVLTIQTFAAEAEAVELANSTRYGLSALIFTSSRERAERVGRAVRAG
ncbi:MAG: aldehyde dehydrogenase family protein, partial [Acidimicrobiales bacterium]